MELCFFAAYQIRWKIFFQYQKQDSKGILKSFSFGLKFFARTLREARTIKGILTYADIPTLILSWKMLENI